MDLSHYIGQEAVKRQLKALLDVAKSRSQPLPHILLCAGAGMGKRTLAQAIANEVKKKVKECTNPLAIERPGDVAALLTNLEDGDILLILDIELIKGAVLEVLFQAIHDGQIDIMIGQGPAARLMKLPLRPFTMIGTTSKPSQVDKRLRRSLIVYDFGSYSLNEIAQIIKLALKERGFTVDPDAAKLLAEHCPGDAGPLINRIVSHLTACHITSDLANSTLEMFGYFAGNQASRLLAMNAIEFEEYVAGLFQTMGYVVDFTPTSGDHGIDLLLRKENRLIAVQCKHWNAPVGEPVVRDFFGSLTSVGAESGYLITVGTFTARAFAFAQDKPIKLIDLDSLIELATQGAL